jgi:hypothetical protein
LASHDAEQITQAVSSEFQVAGYRWSETSLLIDLESPHPLAYGALKDLADLVIDRSNELNVRLLSAAIQQVQDGPEILATHGLGRPLARILGAVLGIKRYVPVMYFYQNMAVDLQLAARINGRQMKPVAELN